jgi:nucleolar protein 4
LYTLDGRVLQISQAVSREEAARLTESGVAARQGKDKDKRRLYLLSEGTISANSPLYAALAPTEVKMRDQSAAQRKKLIQSNPSLHLSLTRLAIRNIPRGINSKDLKALAREAVVGFATDVKEGRRQPLSKEEVARGGAEDKEAEHKRREKGKGVVKQAKIVFENKQGSKVAEVDDAGKSRGYGFIEYSSHRWALMGLRWLNGHAVDNAAGKSQRLIVEFAIENAQVVARRRDQQGKFLHWGSSSTTNKEESSNRRADSKSDGKRPGKKGAKVAGDEGPPGDGKSAARNALEQKIIGRKRLMKKKKANARRG